LLAVGIALAVAWAGTGCGDASQPARSSWQGGRAAIPAPTPDGSDGTPSTGPSPTAPANPFTGRVPAFPPAPPAVPLTLPAGPSAPIFKRLPITAPVAFLTIDDGLWQVPQALPLMTAAHIPFTMFLIAPVAAKYSGFFSQLESDGGTVEDHTLTHPELRGKGYAFQRHEICDAAGSLTNTFGSRPTLFRPPFGDYDQTTLRAAHDCGIKAVFYWSETVVNGAVRYQTADHRIQPGDIILMHFRTTFVADVIAALTAISKAGLTPALLENYIT
jgi:peptidoglycan/xylan/chitin deacetylase (PgdA/CDA1 family)